MMPKLASRSLRVTVSAVVTLALASALALTLWHSQPPSSAKTMVRVKSDLARMVRERTTAAPTSAELQAQLDTLRKTAGDGAPKMQKVQQDLERLQARHAAPAHL
jgi:septal ring factor EnvC (AmiA/AmiB activator)